MTWVSICLESDRIADTGTFTEILTDVNSYIWYFAFLFLIGLGIYFTYKLRAGHIRRCGESLKMIVTDVGEKPVVAVSSFQAFCIGLGERVGVGNVAGVASAIVTGGPGAIFWMWIFAIIGSASSFMESTLGQIFKERKSDGFCHGGPAYYVKKGLGNRKLAYLLAILTICTFGIGFVGVQAANAANALEGIIDFEHNDIVFGLLLAGAIALVIFGGLDRIGWLSQRVVPVMAIGWILLSIVIVLLHLNNIGHAFMMIFEYAFGFQQVAGGLFGAVIMSGLKRGVFSNEAGLGSIANIASTAEVRHPVKQGMIQSLGTLIDTLVVCTFTALALLCTFGSYEAILDASGGVGDAQLVQQAIEMTIGPTGTYIMAVMMVVLAFTSIIGYYTMSETNTRFMSGSRWSILSVRLMAVAVAFIACVGGTALMELVCDTFMAAMGAVNIVCVFLLSRYVYEAYRDWKDQRAAGIMDPVFCREVLSDDTGVTEWGPDMFDKSRS